MDYYPRRQRKKMEWLGYREPGDTVFPLEDKWAAQLVVLGVVVREGDARDIGKGLYHMTPQGKLDCDRLTRLPH